MKKIYSLLALALIAFSANAQVFIDFDSFTPGDVSPQSADIILWPASGITDAQVTAEQAYSNPHSIVLRENAANVDDILVLLGDQTAGTWSITYMMYVPTGKTGYWNIQNSGFFTSSDDAQWNGQFFVGAATHGNRTGTPGTVWTDQNTNEVAHPSDQWFKVTHVIDLDNSTHTVDIDGSLLINQGIYGYWDSGIQFPADKLGAVNFYAIDGNNRYYVDDFELQEGSVLSTPSFEANSFNVYPNPVSDRLNIRSQNAVNKISIYNVLGKLVYQATPQMASPSVDMASFKSGVYFVEVTIGNSTKTVKVIR